MALVCVSGASVSLQPLGPQVLLPPGTSSTIPASAQNKLLVDNKPALLAKDIEDWAKRYINAYTNGNYVGGTVQGDSVSIAVLANNTKAKSTQLILQNTQITLTVKVLVKATNSANGSPDPTPQFTVKVSFTNPGQTKFTSV